MKKFIFMIAILAIAQSAFSQKRLWTRQVPVAVKSTFAEKFPNTKVEKWELEDGNYEAVFHNTEKVKMSSTFALDGKWLQTEHQIKVSALPEPILNALKGKNIKEAAEIQNADGSTIYEAEVGGKDLFFDAAGNAVK
jgi:hypothetical protein